MVNILYISYDGMTDPLGQSQVLPYLVALSKKNYHFTLLSFEKKKRFDANKKTIEDITQAASIDWIPMRFTYKPPILSKLYDVRRMIRKAVQLHKEKNFSIIHCRSYIAAEAGLRLKQQASVPFLFDMRGFWVNERVDNGQWDMKNPFFKLAFRVYKKKEKKFLKTADHIISLTEKGKVELTDNYNVPADKITVIPCCVDLGHFDFNKISETDRQKTKEKLGIRSTDKVLTYLGSLGGWYMIDEMLDFFKVLNRQIPESRFLFITHDSRESILEKAAKKGIGAEQVITVSSQRKDVPLYLSLSEWSIFFIKDAYSKKGSSPTKQGETMAMGIRIVCNDVGDTAHIINSTRTGIVVKQHDADEYVRAVSELQSNLCLPAQGIRDVAKYYFDLSSGVETYATTYSRLLT